MGDKTTQIGVRFSESLWEQFRDDVRERKGSVNGHLRSELEAALREYLDASGGGDTFDRLQRIEDKVDQLDRTLSQTHQEKKGTDVSQTTEKRVAEIRDQIDRESGKSPKVHEEVVELAIRENAGSSDPTIRRYKDLLQQDECLFPHPLEDRRVYYTDATEYVLAVNALRKGGRIKSEPYHDIVDEYGRDWWLEQQEGQSVDQPKGFQ